MYAKHSNQCRLHNIKLSNRNRQYLRLVLRVCVTMCLFLYGLYCQGFLKDAMYVYFDQKCYILLFNHESHSCKYNKLPNIVIHAC